MLMLAHGVDEQEQADEERADEQSDEEGAVGLA
jgi:hypothetical protein